MTDQTKKYQLPINITSNLPPQEHKQFDSYNRSIFCLNCNGRGHVYKKCHAPLNSYGIIVFKKCRPSKMKYLMVQRKYSHSFVDILLGRYYDQLMNIDFYKLSKMIKYLPVTERYIYRKYDFKFLWSKIWMWNIVDLNKKYHEYHQKFANAEPYIIKLFNEINPVLDQPEWEFPKGKRIMGESDRDCAIRECTEETTLTIDDYYIYPNLKPFIDKFTGTDGNEYCNNFLLAEILDSVDHPQNKLIYYDCTNFDQTTEIRKIAWFAIDDIEQKIKDIYPSRFKMISHINMLITCWQSNNRSYFNKFKEHPLI